MKHLILWIGLAVWSQLFAAVSLNSATLEELSTLKGIGESTAQKIVEYRDKHTFKRIDELMNVKGIGPKKFEQIKGDLSL